MAEGGGGAGGVGRGGGEGVRTRDHLANSRTFLAWAHLGIAMVGLGYVVEKFRVVVRLLRGEPGGSSALDHAVAVAVTAVGVVLTIAAFTRFMTAHRRIERSDLRMHFALDAGLILLMCGAGLAIAVYIVRAG